MTKADKRMIGIQSIDQIVEDFEQLGLLSGTDKTRLIADWRARGSRIEELEKRIARMGEALKPFYDAATTITEEEALRARDGLTDFEYEKFDALNGEAK